MPPHRDELEAPLGQLVIAGIFTPAPATHGAAVQAWLYLHLQRRTRSVFNPANGSVDKCLEFLDSIEDRLDLHPVPLVLTDGCFATSIFLE